jgi:hypothetical protein
MGRPFRYSTAFSTDAVCADVDCNPIENSGGKFVVVAKFASSSGGSDESNPDKDGNDVSDPLLWHDEIDISTTQVSMPIEYAKYIGPKPVNEFLRPNRIIHQPCNSAGVPFDPLPEFELDITVLRITKFTAGWNDGQIAPYRGTINSDAVVINKPDYNFFLQFGPTVGKIKQWSGTFQIVNKIKCWKQTIELHINPLGWRFPLLDRGTTVADEAMDQAQELDNYGGVIPANTRLAKRALDQDDVPLTEPQLLNGNGKLLVPGKPPVYLLYSKYEEVPYANIKW